MDSRWVVDEYMKAIENQDLETMAGFLHPDVVARYPQSGETFRGRDNYLAMQAAYPGLPHTKPTSISGEESVVILPSFLPFGAPTVTVFGGDRFVVEGTATYPDGEIYNVVAIFRVQTGAIIEESIYFASPFEPADWRRPYAD